MDLDLKKRLLFEKPMIKADKPVMWVHCASVGEYNTFSPIMRELKDKFFILLTYFSPRAKEFLLRLKGSGKGAFDEVFPLPLDLPFVVSRFAGYVRPVALIVVERELWYFLLSVPECKKILVNAQVKGGFRESLMLRKFDLILTREDPPDTLPNALRCGNLKIIQEVEDREINLPMREGCKLIVAGSTREGEEEIVLDAFLEVRSKEDALLVIAPRHISRSREILELAKRKGLNAVLRSELEGDGWDVLILDGLGELRSFYRICDVAIVGGTFVNVGGHNIIEPAYYCKPVIYGPYTHKVEDLRRIIEPMNLGFKTERESLGYRIIDLLRNPPPVRGDLKAEAQKVKRCYLEHILSELEEFL